MKRAVKALGVAASIGMFAVLVMGSNVTNTGSGHGCGKTWPLCNGKLIPQFTVSTFIEWSHRAVVGIESCLVLALAAGAWYLYRGRTEIRVLAPTMVGFLVLQSILGAGAAMYPEASAILALHFGVSLLSVASVFLAAVLLFEIDREQDDALRDRRLPGGLSRYIWGLAAFTYVAVYSGAYVRHTNADDACSGWPLCNGALLPALHGKVASVLLHRSLAGL